MKSSQQQQQEQQKQQHQKQQQQHSYGQIAVVFCFAIPSMSCCRVGLEEIGMNRYEEREREKRNPVEKIEFSFFFHYFSFSFEQTILFVDENSTGGPRYSRGLRSGKVQKMRITREHCYGKKVFYMQQTI